MTGFSQNQKILAVFVLSSLAAGGIYVFLTGIRSASRIAALPSPSQDAAPISANADSDHDGLLDKEELEAFHTDPQKADTDSDGILDGTEVALGSDPLKSEVAEIIGRIAEKESRGQQNATALFLEEFFARVGDKTYYIQTDDNTVEAHPGLGPEDLTGIAEALHEPLSPLVPRAEVRDADIRISADTSRDAVVRYVRDALAALSPAAGSPQTNTRPLSPDELIRYLDGTLLPLLENADEKLTKLPVPAHLVDIHKELLQLVRLERAILKNMKGQGDDVLAQYVSLMTFAKTTDGWTNLRAHIVSRLAEEKVNLPPDLGQKLFIQAKS